MKEVIKKYCDKRCAEFHLISNERKAILAKIAAYIKYKEDEPIDLLFVCSENSRRSMLAQIWAKVASRYFGFDNVETFSGGTEVTEFHGNVEQTLQYIGFDMKVEGNNQNAKYYMIFDTIENAAICFSKLVEDRFNPQENFGAIMTCDLSDQNCPVIFGSELRISLPYIDPKLSDGTDKQMETYLNCSKEIATELLYLFSISK